MTSGTYGVKSGHECEMLEKWSTRQRLGLHQRNDLRQSKTCGIHDLRDRVKIASFGRLPHEYSGRLFNI